LFVRITNLSRASIYVDQSDPQFVRLPPHDAEGLRTQLRDGDVLVSITADIGKIGFVDSSVAKPAYINQHIALLRFDGNTANSRFLSYFLASERAQRVFRATTDQGAKAGMNLAAVRGIKAAFPGLPEQNAISAALEDVDALLASLDKLIAKKRDLKQAAMQQLLTGLTRLPGFNGKWAVKRLGDVAQIVGGGTPKTNVPDNWDGEIPWCTPTDITGTSGKYLVETARTITETGLKSGASRLLPPGTLLLCSRATIGEVRIAAKEVCTNQGFKSLVVDEGVYNEFLYYKLLTMKAHLIERASGSTFLEVSKKDIATLELRLPDLDEQRQIATVLSDMDAEISALEARREKTQLLKLGMMQELLTGRTRLV
jgi:type I restriction enzyme S subunit